MAATLTEPYTALPGSLQFDELETARLRFRIFRPDDLDALCAIAADPDVMRYIGEGHPLTREETLQNLTNIIDTFHRRGFGRWALADKSDGSLIGYGGFAFKSEATGMEIVYMLARSHWGRGLALEVGRACLRYCFEEMGVDSISGCTRPGNIRSRRVLERLGFRFASEGTYFGYSSVQYVMKRDMWTPDDSFYLLRRGLKKPEWQS